MYRYLYLVFYLFLFFYNFFNLFVLNSISYFTKRVHPSVYLRFDFFQSFLHTPLYMIKKYATHFHFMEFYLYVVPTWGTTEAPPVEATVIDPQASAWIF